MDPNEQAYAYDCRIRSELNKSQSLHAIRKQILSHCLKLQHS